MQVENDMADWMVAIGTLALAFVAVFQDQIRSKIWSPVLGCQIELKPPDCHRTTNRFNGPAPFGLSSNFFTYYFRLQIWNKGKTSAKNVEVLMTDLLKQVGNSFQRVESFSPDNLTWSTLFNHVGQHARYCEFISPDTYKHCNLGHIHDPVYRKHLGNEDNQNLAVASTESIFSFGVHFKSNILYYLVSPGTYRVKIKVGCENASTIEKQYEITITGKWFEDETQMLDEGITITELKGPRA